MPFVEFTQDAQLLGGSDEGFKVKQSFKAGQVVEMSSSHAHRWVRRNMAKVVQGRSAKVAEPRPTLAEPPRKKRGRPPKTVKRPPVQSSSAPAGQASVKPRPITAEEKPS